MLEAGRLIRPAGIVEEPLEVERNPDRLIPNVRRITRGIGQSIALLRQGCGRCPPGLLRYAAYPPFVGHVPSASRVRTIFWYAFR